MGRRIRPLLGSLLLVIVSTSAVLLVMEVALRMMGYRGEPMWRIRNTYQIDDPILDWRYVPNSEVRTGRVLYRYNGAGFRDDDHAVQKPAGTTRIVVIGDSVSEGYEVEWKSVFAGALQTQLGDRYEVINIAAGGLNTPQEIHLLERVGLAYDPDLVVLNFVLNDVDFYTRYQAGRRAGEEADSRIAFLNLPVPPYVKRFLKSSALIYLVKDRLEGIRARLLGTDDDRDYYQRIWASEQNRRKVTDGFSRLAALRSGGRFEVVVIIWPLIVDYARYPVPAVHTWVAGEAAGVEAFLAWYRSQERQTAGRR
jgi:hypothetical protein